MRAKLNWAVLPILRGPLRGFRWLVATRSSFLFGTYEPTQTRLFEELVKPGDVVYDIVDESSRSSRLRQIWRDCIGISN
jgi:hypothetical protein